MNYGDILKRSWKITWRYRALWLFGLLASCTSSRGGGGGSGGSNFTWQQNAGPNLPPGMLRFMAEMERFAHWLTVHPEVILMFLLAVFLLMLGTWLLGLIGTAGVISGFRIATTEEAPEITIPRLWQAATDLFGRFFGFSLFNGLVVLGSIAVFYGPPVFLLIFGARKDAEGLLMGGFLLICCSLLIWLFLLLIWQAVYLLGRVAIVVEDLGVWDALHRAWNVLRSSLGEWVVLALILFVIGVGFGILLIIPALPTVFAVFRWMNGADLPLLRIIIFNMLVAMPIGFFLNAVYHTFYLGVWTLAYQDVMPKPVLDGATSPTAPMETEADTTYENTSDA